MDEVNSAYLNGVMYERVARISCYTQPRIAL
jgi:hypothetical protein